MMNDDFPQSDKFLIFSTKIPNAQMVFLGKFKLKTYF
jgi:hypothetical protein